MPLTGGAFKVSKRNNENLRLNFAQQKDSSLDIMLDGATTLSTVTLSIMAFSIRKFTIVGLIVTYNTNDIQYNVVLHFHR
jgi:hypothetical protein